MKTYYSIVSIATKPQFNEKFGVGLLCVTPTDVFFHFSKSKFDIVSKLLPSSARKLALANLNAIEQGVQDSRETPNLLFKGGERSMMVAESYISYLHRYNNNLVQFTAPETIDVEVDYTIFKALFQKYIYSNEVFDAVIKPKKRSFIAIRNNFRKAASAYANTDFNVTKEIIQDLIVPVNVDVFGKNGAFVTGQSLDFSKNATSLQSEISSFFYLTEHTLNADKNSMSFVLGDEPSKENELNHRFWKNVCDASIVEFVPTDESERIISYMQEKGVAPIK
jgi:hypothetical protein